MLMLTSSLLLVFPLEINVLGAVRGETDRLSLFCFCFQVVIELKIPGSTLPRGHWKGTVQLSESTRVLGCDPWGPAECVFGIYGLALSSCARRQIIWCFVSCDGFHCTCFPGGQATLLSMAVFPREGSHNELFTEEKSFQTNLFYIYSQKFLPLRV